MPNFSCKVLPIMVNKRKKNCCICFESKLNCIVCTNPKCDDGIICLDCLKSMSYDQRNKCQICRTETTVFKDTPKKNINKIKNQNPNNKNCKILQKHISCCNTIKEGFCTILFTFGFIGVTYCLGLLCLLLGTNRIVTNLNPLIHTVLGVLVLMAILTLCFICGTIKKMCINKIQILTE